MVSLTFTLANYQLHIVLILDLSTYSQYNYLNSQFSNQFLLYMPKSALLILFFIAVLQKYCFTINIPLIRIFLTFSEIQICNSISFIQKNYLFNYYFYYYLNYLCFIINSNYLCLNLNFIIIEVNLSIIKDENSKKIMNFPFNFNPCFNYYHFISKILKKLTFFFWVALTQIFDLFQFNLAISYNFRHNSINHYWNH